MITQDQYNQLVEKIALAVPDKEWNDNKRPPSFLPDNRTSTEFKYKSPELADVMRALSEIKVEGRKILYGLAVTTKGDFLFNCVSSPEVGREWLYRFNNKIGHITWDLSKPLDLQSDATKESLYNLIVKP